MKKFFSFVKIEHTLFSLPVIFSGMALAVHSFKFEKDHIGMGMTAGDMWVIGAWILLAATGARTVGFAMNRIIDRHIDARNPRTAIRDLPSGRMTLKEGYAVMAVGAIIYFLAAWQLNPLCLALSPIPLAVFMIYPYMKRFTSLAHFGVGASLALGPLGAFLAVRPDLTAAMPAILLSLFTWCWVTGFDIIYSTADEQFDKKEGLHSLPSKLGSQGALKVSGVLHVIAFAILSMLYFIAFAGEWIPAILLIAAGVLLYLEQKKATDVELAFFKINAVLGFVVFFFIIVGVSVT